MVSIKLNEDELTVLFGLPHLAIVLYVLGLRPRMDFANGTVGMRPLISWQALREAVYVEPHKGIKHAYASAEAVRRAAGWLEKAGLIRMRSHDRQLVFFLPLAHADQSVRKKADRGPTDQADRGPTDRNPHQQRDSGESHTESRQTKIRKADRHPYTGKPDVNTPPTPFTTVSEGGGVANWIFPKTMSSQQKAAMASKLDGMSLDMGQAVLDELAGCIQAGTVKNLPRLAAYFINQAKNGQFMPDKGEAVRQGREAATRSAQQRIEADRRAQLEATSVVKVTRSADKKPDLLALVGSRKSRKEATR